MPRVLQAEYERVVCREQSCIIRGNPGYVADVDDRRSSHYVFDFSELYTAEHVEHPRDRYRRLRKWFIFSRRQAIGHRRATALVCVLCIRSCRSLVSKIPERAEISCPALRPEEEVRITRCVVLVHAVYS